MASVIRGCHRAAAMCYFVYFVCLLDGDQIRRTGEEFFGRSLGRHLRNYSKDGSFHRLRESEAIGLAWDCIDFKTGTIKVCKQIQKRPLTDSGTVFASLKNDKARILKTAPFVMNLLDRQYREQTI